MGWGDGFRCRILDERGGLIDGPKGLNTSPVLRIGDGAAPYAVLLRQSSVDTCPLHLSLLWLPCLMSCLLCLVGVNVPLSTRPMTPSRTRLSLSGFLSEREQEEYPDVSGPCVRLIPPKKRKTTKNGDGLTAWSAPAGSLSIGMR